MKEYEKRERQLKEYKRHRWDIYCCMYSFPSPTDKPYCRAFYQPYNSERRILYFAEGKEYWDDGTWQFRCLQAYLAHMTGVIVPVIIVKKIYEAKPGWQRVEAEELQKLLEEHSDWKLI